MKDPASWRGRPKRVTELVQGESDRGAILILGSYLEEILASIIEDHCVNAELAADLLEVRRPAGDFDSKIRIAVAFGMIHREDASALHSVRKIRNAAAHFDFNSDGVASMFSEDSIIDQVANLAKKGATSMSGRGRDAVRSSFITSCRLLATKLLMRGMEVRRPAEPISLKEVADSYRERVKGTPMGEVLDALEKALNDGDTETVTLIVNAIGDQFKERLKHSDMSSSI